MNQKYPQCVLPDVPGHVVKAKRAGGFMSYACEEHGHGKNAQPSPQAV